MSSTRREMVTIVKQTVLDGKVVAVTTQAVKRNVLTKQDGLDYVVVDKKHRQLIKGVVLV